MREIVHTAEFDDQLQVAELEFPRIDEFLKGVKEKLRRNPEFGDLIGRDVWFIAAPDVFSVPLCLSYTFDRSRVYLLSIWVG